MAMMFVYVTAPTQDEALRLGRTMVEERWAACANVIKEVASFYWWEGHLQEDTEAVVVMKTRADLVAGLTDRIKELHSYSCPCIVALPIAGGNAAFLNWIGVETQPHI